MLKSMQEAWVNVIIARNKLMSKARDGTKISSAGCQTLPGRQRLLSAEHVWDMCRFLLPVEVVADLCRHAVGCQIVNISDDRALYQY